MAELNKKLFGETLRKFRKAKGLSQENIAHILNVDRSMVARYENGTNLPNANSIKIICDELGISENELFNSNRKINNLKNSINPFKSKEVFLYYIAKFPKSQKFGKGKFVLKITDRDDGCRVDFYDYKDKTRSKIYLSGYLLADSNIAIFVLENYEEYNLRLEVTHIILNIARGTNGLMYGSLHCTNGEYKPCLKKCIVSKEDIEFTDEMYDSLKYSENEILGLKEDGVLYEDVLGKYDFEEE